MLFATIYWLDFALASRFPFAFRLESKLRISYATIMMAKSLCKLKTSRFLISKCSILLWQMNTCL